MAEQPPERVSFPRLDALRALCFFSVFLFHSFHTERQDLLTSPTRHFVKGFLVASGDLGVNVFFVLSGFLITFLLIRERELGGNIHVGHFWLRRLLRIWPLYFACVAFGFLLFPWFKSMMGQLPNEQADAWYYIFFAANFDMLRNGLPDASTLAVLWSVGVEEQFYLVWPILLFALPTRVYPVLIACIIAASAVFNSFARDNLTILLHTISCMGDLAMGALGAWFLSHQRVAVFLRGIPTWPVILVHSTLLVLFFVRVPLVIHGVPEGVLRLTIALAAVLVLLCQSQWTGKVFMLPARGPLNYLGRISFGLYCLHPIGILVAVHLMRVYECDHRLWQVMLLQPAIALLTTIGLAALSFHFYESPFLRLKSRFAKVARSPEDRLRGR